MGGETRSLLELSDAQMATVVGGELGNSLQTFGLPSADQLSEHLTRILNQALTAGPGDQSKATSRRNTEGRHDKNYRPGGK